MSDSSGSLSNGADTCRQLAVIILLVAMLFASGDVWPVLSVGFTFRFSQLLIFGAALLLLPSMLRLGVLSFPGQSWAAAWGIWSVLTLPLSLFFVRSAGYLVWLITSLILIFVFVQAFRGAQDVHRLLRMYFVSFIALSLFGVLQFVLGVLGFELFITLWWIPGVLPRVNGLSYEPSYYATYLLPGWTAAAYLLETRCPLVSERLVRWTLVVTTIGLLLSTSRMGWILMVLWMMFRGTRKAVLVLAGRPFKRATIAWMSVAVLLLGAFFASPIGSRLAVRAAELIASLAFLLSGLGLFGTSAHSATQRFEEFTMTWRAFLNYPWFGTGLGALPVEVGAQSGSAVVTLEDAKLNEGMSIFLELLASVGISGALLVAGLVGSILMAFRVAARRSDPAHRSLIWALAWGLIWLVLILQFNQNFLRLYLWMDVAVLIVVLNLLRRVPGGLASPLGRPERGDAIE